jgi:hypothetical protein
MCDPEGVAHFKQALKDAQKDLEFEETRHGNETERLILRARIRGMRFAYLVLHPESDSVYHAVVKAAKRERARME